MEYAINVIITIIANRDGCCCSGHNFKNLTISELGVTLSRFGKKTNKGFTNNQSNAQIKDIDISTIAKVLYYIRREYFVDIILIKPSSLVQCQYKQHQNEGQKNKIK
jgi:hypothetical protein